jgi:excisionase family DNA binding protein
MARPKETLTTGQVAEICNVAPRTVTKWFDSGRLKGYRIPGSRDRRIPRSELKKFMQEYNIPADEHDLGSSIGLLVSDDDDLARSFVARLRGVYEVKMARSGFEAGLAMQKFLPEAVFVSLLTPTIDACAICQNIRGNPDLAGVKVVALADNLTQSERVALLQKGFDQCVSGQADAGEIIRGLEQIQQQPA